MTESGRERGSSAPGGLVRAVVDGSGRLIELDLDPRLLRRQPAAVAQAIIGAVTEAQEAAALAAADGAPGGPERSTVDLPALTAELAGALDEANLVAERRLAQLGTLVSDLLGRADRAGQDRLGQDRVDQDRLGQDRVDQARTRYPDLGRADRAERVDRTEWTEGTR